MICYVCETDFKTPNTISIVVCPNCKRNIVTDGTDSEEITKLKTTIDSYKDKTEYLTKDNMRLIKITEEKESLNYDYKERLDNLIEENGKLYSQIKHLKVYGIEKEKLYDNYNEESPIENLESYSEYLQNYHEDLNTLAESNDYEMQRISQLIENKKYDNSQFQKPETDLPF